MPLVAARRALDGAFGGSMTARTSTRPIVTATVCSSRRPDLRSEDPPSTARRTSRRSLAGVRTNSLACTIGCDSSDLVTKERPATDARGAGRSDPIVDAPAPDACVSVTFSGNGTCDSLALRVTGNGAGRWFPAPALGLALSFRRGDRSGCACAFEPPITDGRRFVAGEDFAGLVSAFSGRIDAVVTVVV